MDAFTLQQHIHSGIPITRAMDLRVLDLSRQHIWVGANGGRNINVHGTAFAGSIYTVCAMAAWGLVYANLPAGVDLVLASGKIQYRRPVVGDITAHAMLAPTDRLNFLQRLQDRRKSSLLVDVEVHHADQLAVLFRAKLDARYGE